MSTSDPRLDHLEAAFLTLLDRIAVVETELKDLRHAVDFETGQRTAYEAMVGQVSSLPARIDHVEREIRSLRKQAIGLRL